MKIIHGGNKLIRGVKEEELLTISGIPNVYRAGTLSAPTLTLYADTWYNAQTGGTFDYTEYTVNIAQPLNTNLNDINYTVTNLTPDIALFNSETNYLSVLVKGEAHLITSTKYTKINSFFNVNKSVVQGELYTFTGNFASGSLKEHINSGTKTRLVGKTGDNPFGAITHDNPTGDPNNQRTTQWLNWNFNGGNYILPPEQYNQWIYYQTDGRTYFTRNKPSNTGTGHVLNNIDLTGINAPYMYTVAEIQALYPNFKPSDGMGSCATAISPRHVFGANHWHPFIGMVVKFVDNNNNVITRTIVDQASNAGTDQWVGLLDSDLPASIKFFKVLPTNYLSYMAILPTTKEAFIYTFMCFPSYGAIQAGLYKESGNSSTLTYTLPTSSSYSTYSFIGSWQWNGLFGSGSPVFAIINGEVVLLFCLWHAAYSGTNIHSEQLSINTMMKTLTQRRISLGYSDAGLTANYTLTNIDLTGFNNTY